MTDLPPVRRALPEDAGLIAALNAHVQIWHAAHYADRFHADPDLAEFTDHFTTELADPEVTCFLSGDPAQGFALCRLNDRGASVFSPAHRRIYIAAIGVAPDARRLGHGRALIAAARALARDLACHEVLLDTWALNHDAHAFFRAEGMAVQRYLYAAKP